MTNSAHRSPQPVSPPDQHSGEGRSRPFALSLRRLGGRGGWTSPEFIDFARIRRPARPNTALASSPALWGETPDQARAPDLPAPVFAAPPDAVLAAVRRAVAGQPRTRLLREDTQRGQLVYVQRSALFRFPDRIWIQVLPLPDGRTALSAYSASVHGYYDFGVNRRRLKTWLEAIVQALPAAPPAPRV